jgi:hypothetical protein
MIKESKLSKKTLLNMNVWKSCNEQMGNNQSMHLSAGSIRQSPLTPDSTKKFSLQKIVHGAECIVLCSTENACYAECFAAIPIKQHRNE